MDRRIPMEECSTKKQAVMIILEELDDAFLELEALTCPLQF